ncbi:MAG: UvrB/UvrC motif-containing protein, partial [Candidatus Latescibacterota bacterium]
DTERNMNLFRFVNRYAAQEDDRLNLEKWWPYILRIHGTARAMIACEDEAYDRALDIVDETRERISACRVVEAEEFHAEMERSEEALSELQREVEGLRPLSRLEQLQRLLEEAVEREDFERAALLRDELSKLREESSGA